MEFKVFFEDPPYGGNLIKPPWFEGGKTTANVLITILDSFHVWTIFILFLPSVYSTHYELFRLYPWLLHNILIY